VLASNTVAATRTCSSVTASTCNGSAAAAAGGKSTIVASRPPQAPNIIKAGHTLPIRDMSFIDDSAPFDGGRRPAAAGHWNS
jgi:hypothetical protein